VQHGEKLQDAIKNADALETARRKKQKDAVSAVRAAELDYLKAVKELKDAESNPLGTAVSEEEKTALTRAKEIAKEEWEEAQAELMEMQEPQPLTDQGRQLPPPVQGAGLPPAVRDDMPRLGGIGPQGLARPGGLQLKGEDLVQLQGGGPLEPSGGSFGRTQWAPVPRFNTDAEMEEALNAGKLKPGTKIIGPDGMEYYVK
jgi:hypothetical protein